MCWKVTIGLRKALRWVAGLLLSLLKDVAMDDKTWDAVFKVLSSVLDVEATRNIPSGTKTENKTQPEDSAKTQV